MNGGAVREPEPGGPLGGLWVLPRDKRWRIAGLVALGLAGLLLIIGGNALGPPAPGERVGGLESPGSAAVPDRAAEGGAGAAAGGDSLAQLEQAMSEQLESILSQIAGVGRVQAWVTLDAGAERVFAFDVDETSRSTEESDAEGGRRVTEETIRAQQVPAAVGGDGYPPVVQLRAGSVRGVLVVAEGAADPEVRWQLVRAVQAALDVPVHRIQVLAGRSGQP